MNKTIGVVSFAACAATSLFATTPSIMPSSVTMTQNESRTVTVSYRLATGPAVVTLGIETNAGDNAWVALPDANVRTVYGDVNQLVSNTTDVLNIYWQPDHDWPNQLIAKENIRAVVKAWAVDSLPDYLVVDLTVSGHCRYYTSEDALPESVSSDTYRTDKLLMRKIPAAGVEWRMGSPSDEKGHGNSEITHYVTLTKDYFIGVFELTQKQYQRIMQTDSNPSGTIGDTLPVLRMSYNTLRGDSSTSPYNWPNGRSVDASSVVGKLSKLSGLDFDLPTEAQWEYACRGGVGTGLNSGKDVLYTSNPCPNFDEVGWYSLNSGSMPHRVGEKLPNAWGLYDMHGNASEWCLDFGGADLNVDVVDPEGPSTGTARVIKGGYFSTSAADGRCAARRDYDSPSSGFSMFGARMKCAAVAK